MNYYKLIIAYDGTDYRGWHEQPHKKTVEDTLFRVFKTVFEVDGYIVAASRTDAGVHALGQVALLRTSLDLDAECLKRVWNNRLPYDIAIRSAYKVDASFYPKSRVQQKTYWYHISPVRPTPFISRYAYHFQRPFDSEKLNDCLKVFIGTHDFRSFCASDYTGDTIRTVDDIRLIYIKRYNVYRIEVYGERFLYNMIRRIVGACLHVASRPDFTKEHLTKALLSRKSEQTLPNAPAHGLLLYKIAYSPTL